MGHCLWLLSCCLESLCFFFNSLCFVVNNILELCLGEQNVAGGNFVLVYFQQPSASLKKKMLIGIRDFFYWSSIIKHSIFIPKSSLNSTQSFLTLCVYLERRGKEVSRKPLDAFSTHPRPGLVTAAEPGLIQYLAEVTFGLHMSKAFVCIMESCFRASRVTWAGLLSPQPRSCLCGRAVAEMSSSMGIGQG